MWLATLQTTMSCSIVDLVAMEFRRKHSIQQMKIDLVKHLRRRHMCQEPKSRLMAVGMLHSNGARKTMLLLVLLLPRGDAF